MNPEGDEAARVLSSAEHAGPLYVDTSALAKRYLNEARSDEVEEFLQRTAPLSISSLTLVEMRSLVARRRREGSVDSVLEGRLWAALEEDVAEGYLLAHPLTDEHASAACRLLSTLPQVPLRTLDALHLVIARAVGAAGIVTADRVMAAGAEGLELQVFRFD